MSGRVELAGTVPVYVVVEDGRVTRVIVDDGGHVYAPGPGNTEDGAPMSERRIAAARRLAERVAARSGWPGWEIGA